MTLLALEDVVVRFGGLVAIDALNMSVKARTVAALIGPNGAGKSTVFNLITGINSPARGKIYFGGRAIDRLRTSTIATLGIARTFQNIRLFGFMSVLDNVMTGAHCRQRASLVDALLHTPLQRHEEQRVRARAHELLMFVGLESYASMDAASLAYGLQRRLEIARALASDPRLLLLDEPAAGMNPREKADLVELIGRVRDRGVTVLLIEHDMGLVMQISEWVTVLDGGKKIAQGPPEQVRSDPRVIEAYLGITA